MESGLLGSAQRLYLKRNDVAINFRNTVTIANYGTFSVGDGAWDGKSSGFFVGSSSGTIYAGNAISGFAGNLLDLQVGGSSKFKIDSSGNVTIAGTLTVAPRGIRVSSLAFGTNSQIPSGDTTMTSANTFYDGASVGLNASSTYIIFAGVTVLATATAGKVTAKLWDGASSVLSSGEVSQTASTDCQVVLGGVVTTPGGGAVYKISAACTLTLSIIKAQTADNSPGAGATWITALQVG